MRSVPGSQVVRMGMASFRCKPDPTHVVETMCLTIANQIWSPTGTDLIPYRV